ncbi:uncharacterized protein PHACADRAFT_257106 [Phanerochaete carnosa HHB-10118-sp]|uniref:Mitochondrial adapter protein MCP1 transmembrane domain-containing protein n=1 Tax=Phanerochaete carnosa (strain HHB-10118-sp) TaxID=650164 RepID=K5WA17_PHACS|nr:uncharacterized protein PHACADRAFT_257106 [Phanerochaete carnosa HHB-10118-sp]EKM56060.1 hypothetical protein PHACADRAFT_257106 [Phanerochaete carnosa HHB-10118-sp]
MSDKLPSASPTSANASPRGTLTDVLTKLVHGSAPFISTFLLIHLSASALASLGGSSLSSQVMVSTSNPSEFLRPITCIQILGREYYQTSFGETYLLYTPLMIHSTSGLAKRLLAPRTARKLSSLFALAGYSSMFFLLPIHYLAHREYPADPSPPIYSFGPSELDFEYVKYGLQAWPWRSWLLYTGLVAAVAWHATEGMQIIWNTYFREKLGGWRSTSKSHLLNAAVIVVPVLAGIFVMAREPSFASSSFIPRYEAALRQCWVYRV